MNRWILAGAMTAVAVFLGAAAVTATNKDHGKEGHAMNDECAKVCSECQNACEKNFHHCFMQVKGGKAEHAKVMHLSVDCAEFCASSAKLTARHSELAVVQCEACAKACDACAAECDKFAAMPEMKACADACKKCAASCREMVKHAGMKH